MDLRLEIHWCVSLQLPAVKKHLSATLNMQIVSQAMHIVYAYFTLTEKQRDTSGLVMSETACLFFS